MKANALVQIIIGVAMALVLVGACNPQENTAKPKNQVIRTIESDHWNSRAQVVKDPITECCYLRSAVHGGWSYMLMPDCNP